MTKLDDIIFRCFEQGHYWGELSKYDVVHGTSEAPEPPKEPIDRTEANKLILAYITQAKAEAILDKLQWVEKTMIADKTINMSEAYNIILDEKIKLEDQLKSKGEVL